LQALDMRVQWTEVLRDGATAWFSVDGEVSFGTGGGQVAKGDNPQLVQHLGQGVFVGADNVTIDCNIFRTCGGWTAVGQLSDIDNFVCRANCDQHGTPYCPPGVDGISTVQDYGDFFFIPQDTPQGNKFLFDGGTTGRAMNRGGHAVCVIYGGTGTMRGYKSTGDWGTVPTFVPANWGSLLSGDGNRTFQFGGRAALDWHMYNCVLERNGQPVDQPRVEITKIEGTRTSIHDCILRLSDHNGFEISSANCSWNSPFDIRLYNLIVRNVSTAAEAGLTDTLLDINLLSGTWTDVIYMHGITVQDATRDFDDLKIGIYGAGAPGLQTVNYYLTNHAANFANWTVTTDANLDNAPTMTQDADLLDIPGEYLPVSDSISVNQGSHLTTATSAGASSTSLAVADGTWFPDPVYGNPGFGYFSSGFQVHLGGVGNVTYTAISRSAWPSKAATLTLSAAQTWSNGANVNLPISSGTVPNRGVR
jgi:hypothetical protein